jgi:hypothetical protein
MPVKLELAPPPRRTHCNLRVAHVYAIKVQHRRTEEKVSVPGPALSTGSCTDTVDRATERTVHAFQALCNQA